MNFAESGEVKFRFTRHAVLRMAERGLSVEKVESIVLSGKVITRYEDDKPFPSLLVLGFDSDNPWRVVYSVEDARQSVVVHVITVYQPDPQEWSADFTKRKAHR